MKATFLLNVPLPAALVLFPQTDPALPLDAPAWVGVFFLGMWVTITYLDKVKRLPGGTYSTDDSRRIKEVHGLLTFRRENGTERFVYHGQLLEQLAEQSVKFDRTVGMLTQELRTMNQHLDNLDQRAK